MIALSFASGCGSATDATGTAYLNISGNWYIGSAQPSGIPILALYGALESSGGAVTGTLHAEPAYQTPPCVSVNQDLPVTGTIDAANNLTLNTTIAGGAANLQVALTQNLQAFTSGTYSIANGPCAMSSTPMTAVQIPPLTATYTGTLTDTLSTPAVTTSVTAQLTQSSTPTADGYFPLSGTISIAGGCPAGVSVSNEFVEGPFIQEGGATGLSGVILPPVRPSTAFTIDATVGVSSTTCPQIVSIWSGTLTPQ